jgi:hypothetical protein
VSSRPGELERIEAVPAERKVNSRPLESLQAAAPVYAGLAMFALLVANTVMFAWRAADPLIISDGWYYLASFVRKAASGTLTIGDFFAKRTALDHSLPLNKLLLLANYRLFNLDFSLDTIVGLTLAICTLLLIRRIIRLSTGAAFNTWTVQAGFVAICAVYLSLNASVMYEWPLLTMGFFSQFFFVALFVAAWYACVQRRYVGLVCIAGFCLVIADGGGIIAVFAVVLALSILAIQQWNRRAALMCVGLLLSSILVYKTAYQLLAPPYELVAFGPGASTLLSSPHLLAHATTWVRLALSASVLHPVQTQSIFGSGAARADFVIALLLAMAHVWFWVKALRRPGSLAVHVAVCTMLLFYGVWAGVLIARVPAFGDGAFSQPRYVIFYQLNVVALLLMAIDAAVNGRSLRGINAVAVGLLLASAALIAAQIPVTRNGWKREPFEHRYVQQLALQMGQLAANPAVPPKNCLPQLTICRMPEVQRRQLLTLLQQEQLNVFSPSFRARHDLALTPENAATR